MQLAVDQFRPHGDPRLDHHDCATRTYAPRGFSKESSRLAEMVKDIQHDYSAERAISKRQCQTIQNDIDAAIIDHIRCNNVGHIFTKKTGARPDLQNCSPAWRQCGHQLLVPFFIDSV